MNGKGDILLVSANVHTSPYPVYPLGVSYLKSYIARAMPGRRVDCADMNFISPEELSELLRTGGYGYIGLSLRNIDDNNYNTKSSFIAWYGRLAGIIKECAPDAVFVVGGAGYSVFPELLLRELGADYGIKGEGESSLAELIACLEDGRCTDRIEGLVYRDGERTVVNPRENYAESLSLDIEPGWLNYYWDGSGMLNIQTKRGCPYGCIYCSYPLIEGRRVRMLDAEQVAGTLETLAARHGINYVFFTDSVFNLDREYNAALCEEIIRRGVKMSWGAYFSPHGMTRDELTLYKRAGLTHMELGTDSFSDTQLRNYGKSFTWDDVLETSRLGDELGIFYAHFLILGGYGETERTLRETFEASRQLTNTVIFPYIGMRMYPGTRLYDIALAEGRISAPEELLAPVYYIAEGIDTEALRDMARETGSRWVFPDDGTDAQMARFRARKRRGPLWEYLRY